MWLLFYNYIVKFILNNPVYCGYTNTDNRIKFDSMVRKHMDNNLLTEPDDINDRGDITFETSGANDYSNSVRNVDQSYNPKKDNHIF